MKLPNLIPITLALGLVACPELAASEESFPGAGLGASGGGGLPSGSPASSSISVNAPSSLSTFSVPGFGFQIAPESANVSSVLPQFRTSFINSSLQSTNLGSHGGLSEMTPFTRIQTTPAYLMGPYQPSPAFSLLPRVPTNVAPPTPSYVMGPYLQSPGVGVVPSVPASASPSNAGTSDITLLQGTRSAGLITGNTATVPGAPAPTSLMMIAVAVLTLMKSGGRMGRR